MTTQPEINTDSVISARRLSKMYPLYARPQDRLKQSVWYAIPQFIRGKEREFFKEFWALRNISFDIKRGETVGIVGHNGSGKSTLLQIIAGTLAPTNGEVRIHGRVAALLELGSGFNPEFTGRENVYLNGSIWGLTQAEIDAIFDDIVTFADIGQFIEQPVKLYSSGMFVRLAFAVQTFVPKEIFIVDEALAVGDAAFQRKCMVSLEKFKDNGGTVLLVSHDAQTIVRQCERCLLLSKGNLLADGPSKPITDLYQKLIYSAPHEQAEILATLQPAELNGPFQPEQIVQDENDQPSSQVKLNAWFDPNIPIPEEITYGNGNAEITDFGIYDQNKARVNVLIMGQRYQWVYKVKFYRDSYNVHFGMMLKTTDGLDVTGISSEREQVHFKQIKASATIEITFSLKLNVTPGTYFVNAGVGGKTEGQYTYFHRRIDICMFRVLPCDSKESYGLAYLEPHFTYKQLLF